MEAAVQQTMKRWEMGALGRENLALRKGGVPVPAASEVKPVFDGCHGLADLPAALDHLGHRTFGKVVIDFTR